MRAMVLEQNAPIESSPLVRREIPSRYPAAGELRIRVRCCAVCRTDLHIIEGDLPPQSQPIVPGHQVVGVVDARGPGCTRFSVGQRVGIAWLRHTCGACELCQTGRENLCDQSRYTGWHADGGYAEEAIVAEDFAYAIPNALDDGDAAPLLCAGIIGYRALQRSHVPPGGSLLLIGFGASAHLVLQLALHRGCAVSVWSGGERHRELARRMGAAWVGHDPATMPHRVDSAILFAPNGRLIPPALASLKKGGTLALAGIHVSDVPLLRYQDHLFHERTLCSVTANTRRDGVELLAEAAANAIQPRTVSYALPDANRALQDLKAGRIDGAGVLWV